MLNRATALGLVTALAAACQVGACTCGRPSVDQVLPDVRSSTPPPSAAASRRDPQGLRGHFETVLDSNAWRSHDCSVRLHSFLVFEERVIVAFEDQAFYIDAKSDVARPATDLFEGLPLPKSPSGVAVRALSAEHGELNLTLVTCEFEDERKIPRWLPTEVRGRPGRWAAVSRTALRPGLWPAPGLMGSVDVPDGSLLFERAGVARAGRDRYSFVYSELKPAGRAPLPRPTPGTGECAQAMLGHGHLRYLRDGTLMGLGTLCRSGADPLTILPADERSVEPRPGPGPLAVEMWRGDSARVFPLPGAERVSRGSQVDIVELSPSDVWIRARILDAAGTIRPYIASFDGTTWEARTPRDASSDLGLLGSTNLPEGTLLLVDKQRSYRWRNRRIEPIAMPALEACEERPQQQLTHTHDMRVAKDGTTWFTFGKCVISIAASATTAEAHRLPNGEHPGRLELLGDVPVVHGMRSGSYEGGSVARWKPDD